MALYEFFPNYIWNLSVAIAVASGAELGEVVDMCDPIRRAADENADAGTPEFIKQWSAKADTLCEMADEDLARGRSFSAADKLRRASLYYTTAERMQDASKPSKAVTFGKAQDAFKKYIEHSGENCERVEIPYKDGVMPGLFTRAEGVDGEAPCVLFTNGLDSNKELLFWTWLPHALARRGISTLCVDQPGTGETLRLHGIPATPFAEEWATPWFDYLAGRDDVDAEKIGISGISLGGHFAARAAAYEPRFASGAIWGANHNWHEVQIGRLESEGENPVPHYWKHVYWVFGAKDKEDFFAKIDGMNMNGHMDKIKMPFLITHGEQDRQINPKYAHEAFAQMVNSVKPELKMFTPREGGVEHVGADNMSYGRDYIADWFADTLGGRVA